MADTKTGETPKLGGLHVYKPERELHYEDEVRQLIDYEKTLTDEDERPAWTIVVPEKEVAKHKRWFNDSAKDAKRAVRAVSAKPTGDGFVAVEFVLRAEKPAKPASNSASTSDATPEVTDTAEDKAA